MQLDAKEIAELLPFGASKLKGRYVPTVEGKESDLSLKELLKAKKDRIEQPRYLRRSYSGDNYTHVSAYALGKDKHGHGAPEEAVSKEYQEKLSTEARERVDSTPLWQALRELEEKGLTERQKESIRRRVEAARRAKAA